MNKTTATTIPASKHVMLRETRYAVLAWHPNSGWKLWGDLHVTKESADISSEMLSKGWRHRTIVEIPGEEVEW